MKFISKVTEESSQIPRQEDETKDTNSETKSTETDNTLDWFWEEIAS